MFTDAWQSLYQYAHFNNVECLSLFGIAISWSIKEKKAALYFFIFSTFLLFFDFFHAEIKAADPDKYWRYFIWSFSELAFAFAIVIAWLIFDKMKKWMAVIAMLLSYISIFFLVSRLIDRHFFDLDYSYWGVVTGNVIVNYGHLLIGYVAVSIKLFDFFREKNSDYNHRSSNHGHFSARNITGNISL